MRRLAAVVVALVLSWSVVSAQTIVPGTPVKTQAGLNVTDTLWVQNATHLHGNLTVDGSTSITASTVGDSLRANLQFFLGGASIKKILPGTFTHNWNNVTAGTTLDETQAITGVTVADNWIVLVGPITDMLDGLILQAGARVSADGTIKMRMANKCATDVDNPSQSFWFICIKL